MVSQTGYIPGFRSEMSLTENLSDVQSAKAHNSKTSTSQTEGPRNITGAV